MSLRQKPHFLEPLSWDMRVEPSSPHLSFPAVSVMTKNCRHLNRAFALLKLMLLPISITVASASASAICGDLSGRWTVSYETDIVGLQDRLAGGSTLILSAVDSSLQGRASLGNRSDGNLIGCCSDGAFRVAITFRHDPTLFIRLNGRSDDRDIIGSYAATFSDGGFSQGSFRAVRLTTGKGDVVNPSSWTGQAGFPSQDQDLQAEPTHYLDPESNWSLQQEGGAREIFVITYKRNTILMCRNKPLIWQWWL